MAAALVDFARARAIEPTPEKVENFEIFPGEGIFGRIEDNDIYVGNWKIASRAACTTVPKLEGYDTEEKSVGYVFLGTSPAGIFCLSDSCRTGAKEALKELKSMGIKTVMLTGDCYEAAKHAQNELGGALEVVHAELLPRDKDRIIKELQEEGPTAMIGDGVNDAPALATADIGISMGVSGSALATETGEIVLMSNDIQRIPKASHVAKKAQRTIIENVIISISTKAAILGLAIAGQPLVWAAVLADVGTCLLVIFNSMLILRGIPGQGQKCSDRHFHKHNKCDSTSGCSSVTEKNCNGHSHGHESGNGCCDKTSRDLEAQTGGHGHGHGCSEKGRCCESVSCGKKVENYSETGDGVNETMQKLRFEHGNQSNEQVTHKNQCTVNHEEDDHIHGGRKSGNEHENCEKHGVTKDCLGPNRKQASCCNKNGQLESNFEGGLSGIVIA